MSRDAQFGCTECWLESAEETWRVRSKLERTHKLIDESHFHVVLLTCNRCAQSFMSVFYEAIDWTDGDDPQAWVLIPITDSELGSLLEAGQKLEERSIYSLGVQRRSLVHDAPKGASAKYFWHAGIPFFMHD